MERLSRGKHWARADAVHRDGEEIFVSSKAKTELACRWSERERQIIILGHTHKKKSPCDVKIFGGWCSTK